MQLSELTSQILAYGTLFAQIIFVLGLIILIIYRRKLTQNKFTNLLGQKAYWIILLVALVGTIGSLIYSESIGYEPCELCWYQRIFLYPQVIIAGLAIWFKDKKASLYLITLSILGVIFSGYQYYFQMAATGEPCPFGNFSIDCFKREVFEFGYITIPLMALTGFALIILFSVGKIIWQKQKEKTLSNDTQAF